MPANKTRIIMRTHTPQTALTLLPTTPRHPRQTHRAGCLARITLTLVASTQHMASTAASRTFLLAEPIWLTAEAMQLPSIACGAISITTGKIALACTPSNQQENVFKIFRVRAYPNNTNTNTKQKQTHTHPNHHNHHLSHRMGAETELFEHDHYDLEVHQHLAP